MTEKNIERLNELKKIVPGHTVRTCSGPHAKVCGGSVIERRLGLAVCCKISMHQRDI